MKFGENLSGHITSEWRTQYIDYERLKDILYEFKESSPCIDSVEQSEIERHFRHGSEAFFTEIEKELQKVNLFFGEKLNEAARRLTQLKNDVDLYNNEEKKHHRQIELRAEKKFNDMKKRRMSTAQMLKTVKKSERRQVVKTMKELKLAFTEYYLALILIQNYQELNFTGFRKILKKHDKLMVPPSEKTEEGSDWREKYVETAPFYTNKQISQFISQTEGIFINDLEGGDRSRAMKRLRVPPLDQKTKDYPRGVVFRVGLYTGMFSICVLALVLSLIREVDRVEDQKHIITAIKLYRPGLFLSMFMMFVGFNIWGWRTSGVNHVLIFEIDPRHHLSHQHLLEIAAWMALIWVISVLCFIYAPFSAFIPQYAHPVILYSFITLFFFNPIKVMYYKARVWLLKRLWRCVLAGAYPVEFADFWLADQLNSLSALVMDMEYLVCFFSFDGTFSEGLNDKNSTTIIVGAVANETLVDGPRNPVCGQYKFVVRVLLACWPAYIRFAQCIRRYYDSKKPFPHLTNAGKYSTTFFKVLFDALFETFQKPILRILWYISSVISSCYTLAWDLRMDWGFLEPNVEHKLLRDEIVYNQPIYYYMAIIQDIILRFAWILEDYLSDRIPSKILKEFTSTLFKSGEVFRRFVWNFFRLENEHLNNCGEFRAVRDISVAPLREDDLAVLEKMMDSNEGHLHRRTRGEQPEELSTPRHKDYDYGQSWQVGNERRHRLSIFQEMESEDESAAIAGYSDFSTRKRTAVVRKRSIRIRPAGVRLPHPFKNEDLAKWRDAKVSIFRSQLSNESF